MLGIATIDRIEYFHSMYLERGWGTWDRGLLGPGPL